MTTEEQQRLAKIRHDLLIWAGYHRGTGISEEAMPRFHEIIDSMSKFIPEMIIIQGGTCWACGELGSDMTWWHVAIYGSDGRVIGNERKSYLIHKGSACSDLAIKKVTEQNSSLTDLERTILAAARDGDDSLDGLLQEAIECMDEARANRLLDTVHQIMSEEVRELRGWKDG